MASLENACRSRKDVRFFRLSEIIAKFATEERKKSRDPEKWKTKAPTRAKSLRPDNVFALTRTKHGKRGSSVFFLETDRGTERLKHV